MLSNDAFPRSSKANRLYCHFFLNNAHLNKLNTIQSSNFSVQIKWQSHRFTLVYISGKISQLSAFVSDCSCSPLCIVQQVPFFFQNCLRGRESITFLVIEQNIFFSLQFDMQIIWHISSQDRFRLIDGYTSAVNVRCLNREWVLGMEHCIEMYIQWSNSSYSVFQNSHQLYILLHGKRTYNYTVAPFTNMV